MTRPCFLVVDREFSGSISTRKLVIETAKFNVITAYSGHEARETLERFPRVDGVVLDAGLCDGSCVDLVKELKRIQPKLVVITVSAPGADPVPNADYQLESFDPRRLLALLEKLKPYETAVIEARNEDLSSEQRPVKTSDAT
jgi:DNA-binding response OmpR family regulator